MQRRQSLVIYEIPRLQIEKNKYSQLHYESESLSITVIKKVIPKNMLVLNLMSHGWCNENNLILSYDDSDLSPGRGALRLNQIRRNLEWREARVHRINFDIKKCKGHLKKAAEQNNQKTAMTLGILIRINFFF